MYEDACEKVEECEDPKERKNAQDDKVMYEDVQRATPAFNCKDTNWKGYYIYL